MKDKNLSRRHFLGLVGAAGGATAVYKTAMASAEYALLDLDQRVRAASSISMMG